MMLGSKHAREYPKVCVNLQTDVRYNYSVWRLFLWQEEKTAHKKQQCRKERDCRGRKSEGESGSKRESGGEWFKLY